MDFVNIYADIFEKWKTPLFITRINAGISLRIIPRTIDANLSIKVSSVTVALGNRDNSLQCAEYRYLAQSPHHLQRDKQPVL